jgi:DNA-directed RNA polymerase subunit RPC12/RpoP
MSERRIVSLHLIKAPVTGPIVSAPPTLIASTHTVDYTCGGCGTVLLHAEDEQVHNLQIRCTKCGAYNSTGQ